MLLVIGVCVIGGSFWHIVWIRERDWRVGSRDRSRAKPPRTMTTMSMYVPYVAIILCLTIVTLVENFRSGGL